MNKNQHLSKVVEQFSKQAIPFTKITGHFDSIDLLIEFSELKECDTVLDVACGPGIVAIEFAKGCKSVTGIDITPDMIKIAQSKQVEADIDNTVWDMGDVIPLPYHDDSFSLVITRYSFHHFNDVKGSLSEMIRVCKPGGRVMVADVGIDPEKSEAYDRFEIMRDPSHTHALTTEEFEKLFIESGLENCHSVGYGVTIELEEQLKASFPKKDDISKLRESMANDIGVDSLGVNAYMADGKVYYSVPISVYLGFKPK